MSKEKRNVKELTDALAKLQAELDNCQAKLSNSVKVIRETAAERDEAVRQAETAETVSLSLAGDLRNEKVKSERLTDWLLKYEDRVTALEKELKSNGVVSKLVLVD